MRTGRPKHADPSVEWNISIPASLVAKVELLLFDPMTRKIKFGSRSLLVQDLLRAYVDGRIAKSVLTSAASPAIMQKSTGETSNDRHATTTNPDATKTPDVG